MHSDSQWQVKSLSYPWTIQYYLQYYIVLAEHSFITIFQNSLPYSQVSITDVPFLMAADLYLTIILCSILCTIFMQLFWKLPFGFVTFSFSSGMRVSSLNGYRYFISLKTDSLFSCCLCQKLVNSHNTIDTQMPCILAVPMSSYQCSLLLTYSHTVLKVPSLFSLLSSFSFYFQSIY